MAIKSFLEFGGNSALMLYWAVTDDRSTQHGLPWPREPLVLGADGARHRHRSRKTNDLRFCIQESLRDKDQQKHALCEPGRGLLVSERSAPVLELQSLSE